MAQNQIRQLRRKLEQQEKQFQSYRDECKNLQNFLEGESNKKQQQIRKLKQEAITKEKQFKALKIENTSLVNQISFLKNQVIRLDNNQSNRQEGNKIIEQLKAAKIELQSKIQALMDEISGLKEGISSKQQQNKIKDKRIAQLQSQLSAANNSINSTQQQLSQHVKLLQQQRRQFEQLQSRKVNFQNLPTSSPKERVIVTAKKAKRQGASQDQILKKYEDKLMRYQKQIKDLKEKLEQSKSNSNANSPIKAKSEQQNMNFSSKVLLACYIVTKEYYISPIVEVKGQARVIKLFKSSRNGCFQKSLGATKHKFDIVSYESSTIIKEVVDKIVKSEEQCNHSILIYGVKKSNKKQIMSSILTKLFNFLKNKIENEESLDLSAVFIKKVPEEEGNLYKQQADNAQNIIDLLQKLTNLASPDSKKTDKNSPSRRPRIYYFNLRINDFSLQIATSSFTNISYREKQIITTFYNNVLYSKLPDVLQSSYSQKYIILTLNPIVDLYQECRNTLNVTQYKILPHSQAREQDIQGFNKEFFSEMAKRKLESYQKEIQQNLIKIKKVEEQCIYFKSKFDQLESRLKILLSTHHAQSSYLKKSPILLSYEKLLKFVHAVQSKNNTNPQSDIMCPTLRINNIDFDFNDSDQNDEAL